MSVDYDILRFIWWTLLGILLIGFAILDGYDLGAAMLSFVGKTDGERRQVRETIEPTWEGHQVWFVLAGGASFAAWPLLYATSFSGFYIAMFLVLVALILRPVGFNFRNKIADPPWRAFWDWTLSIGGFVPSLVFGVCVWQFAARRAIQLRRRSSANLHRQLLVCSIHLDFWLGS